MLLCLLLLVGLGQLSSAYFEFCLDNKLYRLLNSKCEGGFLFKVSTEVSCTYPKEHEYTVDVCNDEKYVFDVTGAAGDDRAGKVQWIETMDDDPPNYTEEPYTTDSCFTACGEGGVVEIDVSLAPPPRELGEVPFSASEERENMVQGVIVDDKHVKDQTERLFLYLSGLIVDDGEGGPNTRIVQVMRKSFETLRQHCPQEFMPEVFVNELERAFFYILREGDVGKIKDISEEDFNEITKTLESCNHILPSPFSLEGQVCQTKGIVHNITSKGGLSLPYQRTDDSFRWGKYDLPVDAAWQVGDFVHGLCYGKFRENVNKHHQYQVALESLFTKELLYRWQRPFKLGIPESWDHMLQADMKVTMRNLDACVQGAYLGSPFLRRLQRPMVKEHSKRKKREISEEGVLSGNAFCYTDTKEGRVGLQALKKSCTNTNK